MYFERAHPRELRKIKLCMFQYRKRLVRRKNELRRGSYVVQRQVEAYTIFALIAKSLVTVHRGAVFGVFIFSGYLLLPGAFDRLFTISVLKRSRIRVARRIQSCCSI